MNFKNQCLTVSLVSEMLNCSDQTIRRWVKEKKIPCIRAGRKLLFSTEDLDKWIQEHKMPTENERLFNG